ncbi:Mg2+-importing ATPase [Pedococcus cremeus]|uniref:Magnesium-transporting ATPase, P-type 1 n=1 Tax=Pedococcus cremeus TaxID=587636 RepID=A0A1H9XH97_9MICO|nr:magnesium-translocating P-type ATPase [Pedococcus cremeus]SES45515.1 Mg2+-importing ATPase [Pedococcus cremeus]
MTVRGLAPTEAGGQRGVPVSELASLPAPEVLRRMGSSDAGLDEGEAARRLAATGPNAVRTHHARAGAVLLRQLRSPLLVLLAGTALVSFFLGEQTDAIVIGTILVASVGLSFVNEYRAERATAQLHAQISHRVTVLRGGVPVPVDVVSVVPGDVVRLVRGEVVPADVRLLEATGLQCDEGVLTGESVPVNKDTAAVDPGAALGDLTCCALMGTVVRRGNGVGVVVGTGGHTEFGRVAAQLGDRQPETEFQAGLRRFSGLLLRVAITLMTVIVVANVVLQRPLVESLLFALAIAVGITPQLLPAVVSTSLAIGSRDLARRKVLVKRLVCIEDLGDMDILVTDKTGTLTEGHISLTAALDPAGHDAADVLALGRLAGDAPVDDTPFDDPLEQAMWVSPIAPRGDDPPRLAVAPFDHDRQLSSALVRGPDGIPLLVVKGAPETVLARCVGVPAGAHGTLENLFAAGGRVIAVATRPARDLREITPSDESGLSLAGYLVFLDQPKQGAAESLERLAQLGVTVKVCTGDNALVAQKVCDELGLPVTGTLTGSDLARLDEERLVAAAQATTIFARVNPEQKAMVMRVLRRQGRGVGFLGDGVNDALALHSADIGISVDTAVDVAKDAADVILLEKDLGVLADGITEGRGIFANTIKYVLMGTSSNFGNMFSAAAASGILSFLPMLPSQILLNNLLYDSSQLAIPTDRVDPEQLRAPSHWDIGLIRRFMLFFGPISSLFDFLTFAIMLGPFHAGPSLFRAGWFVESLATQTLIIFAIRTRRPMLRSRPSAALMVAAGTVVLVGAWIPLSPLAGLLGFASPPATFYAMLAGLVLAYLALVELAKRLFYAEFDTARPPRPAVRPHRRLQRRASRFSVGGRLPS